MGNWCCRAGPSWRKNPGSRQGLPRPGQWEGGGVSRGTAACTLLTLPPPPHVGSLSHSMPVIESGIEARQWRASGQRWGREAADPSPLLLGPALNGAGSSASARPPTPPEDMGTMGLGLPRAGRTLPQLLGALLCWKLGVHWT